MLKGQPAEVTLHAFPFFFPITRRKRILVKSIPSKVSLYFSTTSIAMLMASLSSCHSFLTLISFSFVSNQQKHLSKPTQLIWIEIIFFQAVAQNFPNFLHCRSLQSFLSRE